VSLVLSATHGENRDMASIEKRGNTFRVIFRYGGRKYNRALRTKDEKAAHPRTGQRLGWQRVVDFFHAAQRIWQMADVLFSKDDPRHRAWARRMLKALKRKCRGIKCVLHSAAALVRRLLPPVTSAVRPVRSKRDCVMRTPSVVWRIQKLPV